MAEISINEYIRTDNGIIDRIIIQYKGKCNNPNCNRKHISCEKNYYDEESIVKHSKDIIDLVQKDDYINGKRVVYIDTIEDGDGNKKLCVFVEETQDCIEQNEIKSIVTKEQIKQIEFRIGD